jgi:outer membrane protein OmpA-like peptidoglycan-associated protein
MSFLLQLTPVTNQYILNPLIINPAYAGSRGARVMNNFPEIKLEVDVHTDSKGSNIYKNKLSQTYARVIVNYLKSKGIENRRLIPRGMGGTKPIAYENIKENIKLNRRVDFRIVK